MHLPQVWCGLQPLALLALWPTRWSAQPLCPGPVLLAQLGQSGRRVMSRQPSRSEAPWHRLEPSAAMSLLQGSVCFFWTRRLANRTNVSFSWGVLAKKKLFYLENIFFCGKEHNSSPSKENVQSPTQTVMSSAHSTAPFLHWRGWIQNILLKIFCFFFSNKTSTRSKTINMAASFSNDVTWNPFTVVVQR